MATKSSIPAGASPEANVLTKRVEEASKVMKITEDAVWTGLAQIGIEKGDADALALLDAETTTEKDAQGATVFGGVPVVRFKAGWAALKGQKADAKPADPRPLKLGKVAEWTDQDLIAAYGVDCDSRIADELDRRAKAQPFVIFNEDGTVCASATGELLRSARRLTRDQRMPETYLVEGSLRRVCRAGEFPQNWMEECPLHADTTLVNGYCDKCQLHWTKVPMEARVVARLAVGMGEVKKGMTSAERAAFVLDLEENGAASLLRVPAIRLKHDEAKENNQLPILRRRVSKDSRGKDPFYAHRTY